MSDEKKKNTEGICDDMVNLGSSLVKTPQGTIYILTIIGQIEGHQVLPETTKSTKYEHILPLLASIEADEKVDGVLILLNTVGGDIEAGLAISELIAGMKKPTVSLVLGGGHSIGVPLAVSAKVSMIVPTASMTIHPIRMSGMVIAAPQTVRYFQRIQERIIQFVGQHSHITEERFEELLMNTDELAADIGSIVYGREAVEQGLIDRVGTMQDALSCLYSMMNTEGE